MNTKFEYVYRDASNYKKYGAVIFAGRITKKQTKQMEATFREGEFFIADQVRIPEVFLFQNSNEIDEDDHCWHAYCFVEHTESEPNDVLGRTILQFIAELEAAKTAGWKEFDVNSRGKKV